MRNSINIKGNDQIFTYVIEYIKGDPYTDSQDIHWSNCEVNKDTIHLFEGGIKYFRHKNDWYKSDSIQKNHQYIPNESINTSKIRVYLPNHSISAYKRGVKYAINVNTWINGYKIDLGSFIFKPTDTIAVNSGTIKYGNNEYHEYVEFDIIDPFYITYSDSWIQFRNKVCKEPLNINSTGSLLCISLYVIDSYDDRYIISSTYSGGMTNFNISKDNDYLKLNLSTSLDPLGLKCDIEMNSVYNWLLDYLKETYDIITTHKNIKYELVIKNKESVIIGPTFDYSGIETYGKSTQNILLDSIINDKNMSTFLSTWDAYEDGWNFVMSLNIIDDYGDDIFNIVSNEVPITQEIFSKFIYGGAEKIIDIDNMNIEDFKSFRTYNVVNKIENKIFQIERPNDSKKNIMQPVFFRVKETEVLTIHPVVTENICINLDEYKSKVDRFILQIDNCRFDQIGSNNYGILFKVVGNKLSSELTSGVYYILNENLELVTTGKYNCVY